jgi:hypothetical protein
MADAVQANNVVVIPAGGLITQEFLDEYRVDIFTHWMHDHELIGSR